MIISFKNNNMYYYDYKIFDGELSPFLLILFFIILFFYKDIFKYISYSCIAISIIGIYDSYLRYKKYNLIGILIYGLIFHLLFIYPLIDFKKYFKPNYIQFFILIFALTIINFMPRWPYLISRKLMTIILFSVYLVLIIGYTVSKI